MFYTQVAQGKVVRIIRRPPSGLSEAERKDRGILPVVHNRPAIDPLTQEAVQLLPPHWDVQGDHVEVAYKVTTYDLDEERLKAAENIRRIRKLKEEQGVDWTYGDESYRLRTDQDTQAKVANVLSAMSLDPELTAVDWEIQPGVWLTMTTTDVQEMAKEITRHVQAIFSRSKTFEEQLQAAEGIQGIRQVLEAAEAPGWPGDPE